MMKLDLAALKLGGQEQEIEDDGFLDSDFTFDDCDCLEAFQLPENMR